LLTVLYARAGSSLFSVYLARLIWGIFRLVSKPFGRSDGFILSFCGPAILVSIVIEWALGLALGAGLIFHPNLGTSITTSGGATPTDFISAFYAGGSSMSIV